MHDDEDYDTTTAGVPCKASDAHGGEIYLGEPGTAKSGLMEGKYRDAIAHGEPLVATDTDSELSHRLRGAPCPKGYKVHRLGMDDPKDDEPVDWVPMWRYKTDQVMFAEKVSPLKEGNPNGYFEAAGQTIIKDTIGMAMCWIDPKKLDLGHVISLATDHPEVLHEVGLVTPSVGSPFKNLGLLGKTSRDVRSTVDVRLDRWRIYAARSRHLKKKKFNPLSIFKKPAAVTLVYKDVHKHVQSRISSFIIDRIGMEHLSYPERRVHYGIDELPGIEPKLEVMPGFVLRGRKARVAYYFSSQSVESIISKYGEQDGWDIVGKPRTKIIFRLKNKKSQEWAVQALGAPEVRQDVSPRVYRGTLPEGAQWGSQVITRPNVHADEIHRSPLASWENDEAYGWVDFGGHYEKFTCAFRHNVETPKPLPKRKRLPPSAEILNPLTMSEMLDLGLPAEPVRKGFERRRKAEKKVEEEEKTT